MHAWQPRFRSRPMLSREAVIVVGFAVKDLVDVFTTSTSLVSSRGASIHHVRLDWVRIRLSCCYTSLRSVDKRSAAHLNDEDVECNDLELFSAARPLNFTLQPTAGGDVPLLPPQR